MSRRKYIKKDGLELEIPIVSNTVRAILETLNFLYTMTKMIVMTMKKYLFSVQAEVCQSCSKLQTHKSICRNSL